MNFKELNFCLNFKHRVLNWEFFYCSILMLISYLLFYQNGDFGYEWPAIDMLPFFERFYHPEALKNDFYTNIISKDPSPRWIFGYFVIVLTYILRADYFLTMFLLKLFFVLVIPPLIFLLIRKIIKDQYPDKKYLYTDFFIFISITFTLFQKYSYFFSIAWWPPIFLQATPQTASFFMSILAALTFDLKGKNWVKTVILFFLSTMFHFQMSLLFMLFYFISVATINNVNLYVILKSLFFGWIFPVLFLFVLFSTVGSLDHNEFVYIYSMQSYSFHSSHYYPPRFAGGGYFHWTKHFLIVCILILIPYLYAKYNNINKQKKLFLFYFLSYVASVFIQCIITQFIPNKYLAMIGPSRFTFFGYWMIIISWIGLIISMKGYNNEKENSGNCKTIRIILSLTILVILGHTFYNRNIRNIVYEKIIKRNRPFYDFVESTPSSSVFISFFGQYAIDIPNIGKRSIFAGNGFPFSENNFRDFHSRIKLIYGERAVLDSLFPGQTDLSVSQNYFRSLNPLDFSEIRKKYKCDYLVIETTFSSNFSDYKPIFEDSEIKVYEINQFKP